MSSRRNWEWWTTSYRPPKSGYSFLSVLKQWGHVATIRVTPYRLRVSTLPMIIVWARYSLPRRRGGSPVHFSSGPKMAKRTPAFWRIRENACATFRLPVRLPCEDRGPLLIQGVPHVRDDPHGIQGLARRIGGTGVRAPSALCARVPIEERAPGELLDAVHPERRGLLQIDLLQGPARRQVHEERVHDREDDVHVFRVRHVREEREQQDHMGPPEDMPPRGVRGHDREADQGRRDRLPGREGGRAQGDVRRVVEEERGHDSKDEQEDDRRVEHPLVHEFLRPNHVTSVEGIPA